jgi:hypothetical protein
MSVLTIDHSDATVASGSTLATPTGAAKVLTRAMKQNKVLVASESAPKTILEMASGHDQSNCSSFRTDSRLPCRTLAGSFATTTYGSSQTRFQTKCEIAARCRTSTSFTSPSPGGITSTVWLLAERCRAVGYSRRSIPGFFHRRKVTERTRRHFRRNLCASPSSLQRRSEASSSTRSTEAEPRRFSPASKD